MNYKLLYGDHIIGDVKEDDSDFPTFFGKYKLISGLQKKPALAHIVSYVDYSIRVWPLIEADRMDAIDYEEEAQFMDLIESGNWWLVDQNGKRIAILIPVFGTDNYINWRLDPDR